LVQRTSADVNERYEYDAYRNCQILKPNVAPDLDGITDFHNPYLLTGRRLDILDTGSLKLQYNRNRYYDQYTGRFFTHDPMGITLVYNDGFPARFELGIQIDMWETVSTTSALF
jgi:RHS repeat-associated protein